MVLNFSCHETVHNIIYSPNHLRRAATLAKENSLSAQANLTEQTGAIVKLEEVVLTKKPFIEPELSTPIDVLEATTFFQAASSGVTN